MLSLFRYRGRHRIYSASTLVAAVLLLGKTPSGAQSSEDRPAALPAPEPVGVNLLSPQIVSPETPTGVWARREITVATLAAGQTAPKIDGAIEDPCWRGATRAVGFFRCQGTSPVAEQTEAWLLADSKCLYVAFHCLDSHPELIRAAETQRDGNLDNDDYVGIDIDSQNTHQGYSSFLVSAGGTQAQSIEGGTADNITWAGDWRAAARRTSDGWTCEMAIPFRLLHYHKGADRFGLLLFRRLARESSRESWPYLPPEANDNEVRFLHDFTGLTPPVLAPRPVFLPFVLASAGETGGANGNRIRQGMDIKYPFTTTLTGVATLHPDFQTVEQQVTDISFSYTEKYLSDRRPFFAEGSDYLPWRDQFYSRRIGQIDGGVKAVGKEKNLSIGVLGLTAPSDPNDPTAPRQVWAAQFQQNLDPSTHVAANIVQNKSGGGLPENQTAKLEFGTDRILRNRYRPNMSIDYLPSYQGGHQRGAKEFFHIGTGAPGGHPNTGMNYAIIPDDFVSDLGYNPDLNQRGFEWWLEQWNSFDQGIVENYWVGLNATGYRHVHPDVFFTGSVSPGMSLGFRNGWGVNLNYNQSRRDAFHDHTTDYDIYWGGKTRYQRGGAHLTAGQVAGESYRFVNLNQNLLVARPFSLSVSQNWVAQGAGRQSQSIVTGTYRLTDSRALGTRLVRQTGKADPLTTDGTPVPNGTNLYLSYAQHVRAGYDLFVLLGDPNALTTRGSATIKLVQPF